MKNLKDIILEHFENSKFSIIERLHITKDTGTENISSDWDNKDKYTKYTYNALNYIFNAIKDKINWKCYAKSHTSIVFDETSLTYEDLDELCKKLNEDKILSTHEYILASYKNSSLTIYTFKERLINIYNSTTFPDKYVMILTNDAITFYDKYLQ